MCKHNFKTISMAHDKDYQRGLYDKYGRIYYPTYEDEEGNTKQWGKRITIFVQECENCHELQDYQVDGWHEIINKGEEE